MPSTPAEILAKRIVDHAEATLAKVPLEVYRDVWGLILMDAEIHYLAARESCGDETIPDPRGAAS